jgi:ATP-dependent DNA helicase RecG
LPGNLFETICAMLNRDGGDIILGVKDNGSIIGVTETFVPTMVTNLVNLSNNNQKLDPPFILYPQTYTLGAKIIIHIQVPASSQVHKTAGVTYDRSNDGDFKVMAPHLVAEIYNRKRNHYTEGIIYPAVRMEDLNQSLFSKVRNLIKSNHANHPWLALDDTQLLQKAGLWKRDYQTGQEGYTLAAVLLFGKDEVIQQVVPHYKTDALVRIQDKLRYDDREYIQTNLVDAYEQLMAFVSKHLPDRFYMEGNQRISLRTKIFREIIANIIAHREYTNAQPATLIIKSDAIETENANNPHGSGPISADAFTPFPKNPTIAKFMMQLGWVEELGSGVLNVNKYWQLYGKAAKPQFIEGAAFKIILPVSDSFFAGNEDGNKDGNQDAVSVAINRLIDGGVNGGVNEGVNEGVRKEIVELVAILLNTEGLKVHDLVEKRGKSRATIERYLKLTRQFGITEFKGSPRTGGYYITNLLRDSIENNKRE